MSLIVDASVAVKWVVDEPDSERARAVFLADECWAPDLILAEVGNTLWKYHRAKRLDLDQAIAALRTLPTRLHLFEASGLASRALELATELDHPIYDCFYLALAERERAPLITADRRLLAATRRMKGVAVKALA